MANRYPLIVDPTTNQIKEIENGDNLNLSGNDIINAENITANYFFGDGSNLTGINVGGSNDGGTFTQDINGNINIDIDGTITANSFTGNGSALTNVNAATLDSIDSSKFLRTNSANQKTNGTLTFNDNVILSFGTSNDVELFCNASDFYIDLNTDVGNLYIRDTTTTKFTFNKGGNFTAIGNINYGSDVKLKTNIKTLTNSLDKVINLRGVEYDRIDMNNKHEIGVIAQEVESIVPELVGENNGLKTVSYGNITALLIEAIKEQQHQINYLKLKLEKLEK